MNNFIEDTYKNKWLVLIAISSGTFLAAIDASIVNIALPTLETALQVDFATIEWVVLGYLLTVTTLILGIGRLGDMFGKKYIYFTGLLIFLTGSILCGQASTVNGLIAFRVIQAIGAAMIMALGTAIITEAFPANERGRAIGIIGGIISIGVIAGPSIGGIILANLSWRWLFYVNLPIGVIGITMVWLFVPYHQPASHQPFDFWGMLLIFISLLSLLFGLTYGQHNGFSSQIAISLFIAWLLFLACFIFYEQRVISPLIDLNIFKNPLFSINIATGFLTYIASSGTVLLLPFLLQNVMNFSTQSSGLMMGVVPLVAGIIAPFSGHLSDRVGPRPLAFWGLLLIMLGYFSATGINQSTSYFEFILRIIPIGLGTGLFQAPNNSAIMGSVTKNHLGVASSLMAMTRTLGQTTGIAILGAIWSSRVAFHAGLDAANNASIAPISTQVLGFQDTISLMVVIAAIATILSAWAWAKARSQVVMPQSQN